MPEILFHGAPLRSEPRDSALMKMTPLPSDLKAGSFTETGFGGAGIEGRRPVLVVGSPSKDDSGVLEEQEIRCVGDGGFFTLK